MKNILITGGSRGLGLVLVKNLLESGYSVYSISRKTSDELSELKNNFDEKLIILNYDLENTEGIEKELLSAELKFKIPFSAFINNAAIAYDDIITNLDFDPLLKMYKVNVFSPMIITKYIIRNMLFNKINGSIIHLSSISVHTGYKGLAMYASTKGALEAFSKNTAREWGQKGIRSNCIVAGFMETDMNASLSKEQKDRIYNRTSLKQPTDTLSVASTIEHLISEKSKSITGQNIFVDSGTI